MESLQLQHDTPRAGAPCLRCGLKMSQKTAYIPCFIEGDTLKTWVARHARSLIAAKGHVPDLLIEMAEIPPMTEQGIRARITELNAAHREQLHVLAKEVRERLVVPACKKHGLAFCGRIPGDWYFCRSGPDYSTVARNVERARQLLPEAAEDLVPIFSLLALDVSMFSTLGDLIGDVL